MSKKKERKPRVIRPDAVYLPHDPDKETIIVSDMDGTLSQLGGRNPYFADNCDQDPEHEPVVKIVKALTAVYPLIVVSARYETVRSQTERWLKEHGIPYRELIMRRAGDNRNDGLVKAEIARDFIYPRFNVEVVFDDRDRVVNVWRWLGFPCFQVQFGGF